MGGQGARIGLEFHCGHKTNKNKSLFNCSSQHDARTHTIAHISVNLIQVNCFSAPITHRQWRAFVASVLLHPEQRSEYRAKLVFFWCKFSMTAKVTTARLYLCVAFSGGMVRFFVFFLPCLRLLFWWLARHQSGRRGAEEGVSLAIQWSVTKGGQKRTASHEFCLLQFSQHIFNR